jgi:hypothetical protein
VRSGRYGVSACGRAPGSPEVLHSRVGRARRRGDEGAKGDSEVRRRGSEGDSEARRRRSEGDSEARSEGARRRDDARQVKTEGL